MDYRALAELVMMSFFGLSTFVFAVGLSVRLFLAPTLKDVFGGRRAEEADRRLTDGRLRLLEDRLDGIETTLERIADARDLDRQLFAGAGDVDRPAGPKLERPGTG